MVTFDEELARSLADAKTKQEYSNSTEEVAEWYAILICQAYASEDENVEELLEKIEEHWDDFADAENPHRLAREKHGYTT